MGRNEADGARRSRRAEPCRSWRRRSRVAARRGGGPASLALQGAAARGRLLLRGARPRPVSRAPAAEGKARAAAVRRRDGGQAWPARRRAAQLRRRRPRPRLDRASRRHPRLFHRARLVRRRRSLDRDRRGQVRGGEVWARRPLGLARGEGRGHVPAERQAPGPHHAAARAAPSSVCSRETSGRRFARTTLAPTSSRSNAKTRSRSTSRPTRSRRASAREAGRERPRRHRARPAPRQAQALHLGPARGAYRCR
jgi:hypothetical protein